MGNLISFVDLMSELRSTLLLSEEVKIARSFFLKVKNASAVAKEHQCIIEGDITFNDGKFYVDDLVITDEADEFNYDILSDFELSTEEALMLSDVAISQNYELMYGQFKMELGSLLNVTDDIMINLHMPF